jgi:hypothetical protein
MELNSLLFPAPATTYKPEDLEGEVMYIPRYVRYNKKTRQYLHNMAVAVELKDKRKQRRLNEKIAKEMQNESAVNSGMSKLQESFKRPETDRHLYQEHYENNEILKIDQEEEKSRNKMKEPGHIDEEELKKMMNQSQMMEDSSKLDLSEIQEENPIQ